MNFNEMSPDEILLDSRFTADEKLYLIYKKYDELSCLPPPLKYAILEWKDKHINEIRKAIAFTMIEE